MCVASFLKEVKYQTVNCSYNTHLVRWSDSEMAESANQHTERCLCCSHNTSCNNSMSQTFCLRHAHMFCSRSIKFICITNRSTKDKYYKLLLISQENYSVLQISQIMQPIDESFSINFSQMRLLISALSALASIALFICNIFCKTCDGIPSFRSCSAACNAESDLNKRK